MGTRIPDSKGLLRQNHPAADATVHGASKTTNADVARLLFWFCFVVTYPQRSSDDEHRRMASADTGYNGKVNGLIGFRRRQKPNFLWQYKVRRGDHAGKTAARLKFIVPSGAGASD